jgi:hypothetical protein
VIDGKQYSWWEFRSASLAKLSFLCDTRRLAVALRLAVERAGQYLLLETARGIVTPMKQR